MNGIAHIPKTQQYANILFLLPLKAFKMNDDESNMKNRNAFRVRPGIIGDTTNTSTEQKADKMNSIEYLQL